MSFNSLSQFVMPEASGGAFGRGGLFWIREVLHCLPPMIEKIFDVQHLSKLNLYINKNCYQELTASSISAACVVNAQAADEASWQA